MASLPSSATALRARWVAPLPTRRWAVSRSHTLAWLLLASAVVVALRVPWFHVPLGNDEGGLTYIARTWHGHGSFVYGDVFIDRPPLLLLLFRVAALTGGTAAVRTIGVVLALLLTLVVTLLARELGGRRAVPWAALLAATLGSSVAIGAVFTPAELPAAGTSCSSVLALAVAHRRECGRMRLFFAAGALAVAALLFKQSFLDAVAAGVAYFVAVTIFERPTWRSLSGRLAAYTAGAGAVIAVL